MTTLSNVACPAAGLDPFVRTLLRASGPINAFGAVIFAPPFPYVRRVFGLPDGSPIYLWVLSIWIFVFGVAYWQIGVTGRADRTFLAVGAAGKVSFALVLIIAAVRGALPGTAVLVGLPDLAMAAVFASWLVRTRQ